MSRLVQKSGYIQAGKASGYLKYIATRERVEKLAGSGPASHKQRQLIARLLRDCPDAKGLFEYEDYLASPTAATASAFLTMALDTRAGDTLNRRGYLEYMGTRPRVERHGEHGLFSSGASVSMDAALHEVEAHEGNVWTLIYSLRRADAARLGYDHAEGWRTLLTGKQAELAAALKIQPDHLRWYAAFHDEGKHPHVHVMAWSSDPREGFLTKEALLDFQSKLTNEIFRGELQELYVEKDVRYKELTAAAREAMTELVRRLDGAAAVAPGIEQKLSALARSLETVKGKKLYGYLKKPVKAQVDEIVAALSEVPEVAACYERWNKLKDELDGYYRERPREHLPLAEQKEFRAIKNMVIREAENLRLGAVTFEDERMVEPDADDVPETDPLDMDAREAALRRAAEAGSDRSQYALGRLLEERERLADALPWLERAAACGNPYAQYRLAKLHLTGDGVPMDAERAFELLTASANQNNQWAQYLLGKLYLQGTQVERDVEAATEWLGRAADQGNEYARYLLDHMDERRDPSVALSVLRLLHHLSQIFRETPPPANPAGPRADSKRRRKLLKKRLALGHRIDDHEDALNNKYQYPTQSM